MNKEIIDKTIAALRHNHFEAFFAHNTAEASAIFFRDIFPGLQVETVSWGDSETMKATGVLNELQKNPELSVIDSFAPGMSRKQKIYWRRQALLTDLFLTGSNALTQKGQLVNLDMIGNRVGGITFGPKHVVLFIGINKITALISHRLVWNLHTVQHTHGICLYFLFAHCFITPVRLMEVRYICVILVITVNDLRIYFIKYLFQDLPVPRCR